MAADPSSLSAEREQVLSSSEAMPAEPSVLAFAADPESEHVLREGLEGYRDAQVWPGGLRAAVTALSRGVGTRLLFVDLDEIAYPAGAIHELAAVCEVGTEVVAFGSDGSARFSREVLLAGVIDYLVKPMSAGAVRSAALRAGLVEEDAALRGCVAAFTGSGGSGTTTLAAAVALLAAQRGRYVSVLDLSRPFSTLAFLLDVDPAAGLEQLLEASGRSAPDSEVVSAVRAKRSERIAVYAYRFGPFPSAVPEAEAVLRLVSELRRRSHLVLVDGLGHPEPRSALLSAADRRVVVVEPTPSGAARGADLLERLGEGPPLVVVRNHTRAFANGASVRALRRAALRTRPRVSVPFEPALPALCDRGWPKGQVPKSLAGPVSMLSDILLSTPGEKPLARDHADREARSKPHAKSQRPSREAGSSRRRSLLGAWWPRSRSARPRPA